MKKNPEATDNNLHTAAREMLQDTKEVYKDSLPILLAALGGGIIAGSILGEDKMLHAFETVPGLLLMVPAIMDMRGNIYGSMGARIATGLHQGLIEPEYSLQERLKVAFTAAVINSMVTSAFVAITSYILLILFGMPVAPLTQLLSIMLIAGILSAFTLSGILIVLLFAGYKRGYDPNILIGPIVTTAGDIFGISYLYIAVILTGVVL